MSEGRAMGDADTGRFGADYSFSGTLDVDRLLAEARPRREYVVWREGEEHQGLTFGSTGIQMAICDDPEALGSAIARFVAEEHAFLQAAARFASPTVSATLTWRITVAADSPSVLALSSSSLQLLAARGIKLSVICYPFPGL